MALGFDSGVARTQLNKVTCGEVRGGRPRCRLNQVWEKALRRLDAPPDDAWATWHGRTWRFRPNGATEAIEIPDDCP